MLRFEREWEIFVDPGDYIAILFDMSHLSEQTLKERRRYILLMPGGANDDGANEDGDNDVNGGGYGEDVDDAFPSGVGASVSKYKYKYKFPSGVGASVSKYKYKIQIQIQIPPRRRCQCQHRVLLITNNKPREPTAERLQPVRDSHRYRHHVPHLPLAQVLFD